MRAQALSRCREEIEDAATKDPRTLDERLQMGDGVEVVLGRVSCQVCSA